jgi:hypothetical protein
VRGVWARHCAALLTHVCQEPLGHALCGRHYWRHHAHFGRHSGRRARVWAAGRALRWAPLRAEGTTGAPRAPRCPCHGAVECPWHLLGVLAAHAGAVARAARALVIQLPQRLTVYLPGRDGVAVLPLLLMGRGHEAAGRARRGASRHKRARRALELWELQQRTQGPSAGGRDGWLRGKMFS